MPRLKRLERSQSWGTLSNSLYQFRNTQPTYHGWIINRQTEWFLINQTRKNVNTYEVARSKNWNPCSSGMNSDISQSSEFMRCEFRMTTLISSNMFLKFRFIFFRLKIDSSIEFIDKREKRRDKKTIYITAPFWREILILEQLHGLITETVGLQRQESSIRFHWIYRIKREKLLLAELTRRPHFVTAGGCHIAQQCSEKHVCQKLHFSSPRPHLWSDQYRHHDKSNADYANKYKICSLIRTNSGGE